MADIHLCDGERGGIGKSFYCRALIELLWEKYPEEFAVFDCDRSNDDVRRIIGRHMPVNLAIYSEGERFEDAPNQIYNLAVDQRVVTNLPAQVFHAMKQWWLTNQIAKIALEDGVTFTRWFVTDGSWDSMKLFKKSVGFYGHDVRTVLVKNWGRSDDFQDLESDEEIAALVKKYDIPVMDFPKMPGSKARNLIDRESLTFSEAINADPPVLDRINRARVSRFLEVAFEAIEATGAMPVPPVHSITHTK